MNPSIDQPFGKLDPNNLQSIQYIIREFCSAHEQHDVHSALWGMLKLTLCSTEASDWPEQKRADCIFTYEALLQLVEANYALTDLMGRPSELNSVSCCNNSEK